MYYLLRDEFWGEGLLPSPDFNINTTILFRGPFYNYIVKFKWVDREFLSTDELQRLVNLEINWPRIDMVLDMFVFCCYTGLAYIDVKKLNPDNLVKNIDGSLWIEAKRTKTNAKFSIPLLPNALAILEKYEDHPKVVNGECVLPVLSNQKANAYLKEIADLCGLIMNLTTHWARHTLTTAVNAFQWCTFRNCWENVGS